MKYKSSYFQAFTDLTINFALLFFGNNLQRYHDEVEKIAICLIILLNYL